MPNYDYKCNSCGYEMNDVYQSIKSEALVTCSNCQKDSLYRVIHIPHVFVKGEPKTIAQLAEKNSKKMGKTMVEEKFFRDKESKKTALDEAKKEIHSKINSMGEEQKRRYIEDGKT